MIAVLLVDWGVMYVLLILIWPVERKKLDEIYGWSSKEVRIGMTNAELLDLLTYASYL